MDQFHRTTSNRNPTSIVFGALLILLGIFFLASQFWNLAFHINIAGLTWPMLILVPGVLVFASAFILEARSGSGLAVLGSIISATGLLLLFQNLSDLWATWAYAWTLIVPTAIGVGLFVHGFLRGLPEQRKDGQRIAGIGLIMFLVGFTFFELLIGISGLRFFGLRGFCFPVMLMIFGGGILLLNVLPRRRDQVHSSDPVQAVSSSEADPESDQ